MSGIDRLAELRRMRDFLDHEIALELGPSDVMKDNTATVSEVAELYGVEAEDVVGGARGHQVAKARHGVAWLLKRRGLRNKDIARILGYRDNSIITHAVTRIDRDSGQRALLLGLETTAS